MKEIFHQIENNKNSPVVTLNDGIGPQTDITLVTMDILRQKGLSLFLEEFEKYIELSRHSKYKNLVHLATKV